MRFWPALFILFLSVSLARADVAMLGQGDGEDEPTDEAANIVQAVKLLETPSPTNPRQDKGKVHGCVSGQFSVSGGLDQELAQGLFKESKTYAADLRSANASLRRLDDRLSDTRGISLKIYGVPGQKLLSDPGANDNQDFILASAPAFFVANVAEFLSYELADHASGFNGLAMWTIYHKGRTGLGRALDEKHITNPLNARYWSQVPSKFGINQAKFSLDPCPGSHFQDVSTGPDRLRENLMAHLAHDSACFDFKVQLRGDNLTMPIEDASAIWSEEQAPFVTVARLRLNKQAVRSDNECEKMEFTPWHSIVEHRPLGGISRLREAAYRGVIHLRKNLDGLANFAPSEAVQH